MGAHDAARQPGGADGGKSIEGNATIVSIRPRARIVERLRAVGLRIELKVIGRYVVPIVAKVAS
jgi:hypothetical protein